MNPLSAEVSKRTCAYILEIRDPLDTLRALSMFFKDRGIQVGSLQLHRYRSGNANVILQCDIERDLIHRTTQLMEQMPGIIELQKLEER